MQEQSVTGVTNFSIFPLWTASAGTGNKVPQIE